MENTNNEKLVFTFQLMLMIPGAAFWLILGFIVLGHYQVGWKSPDSKFETVINQINPEAEARQQMAMIDDSQQAKTSNSMKRLGVR